MIRPKQIKTANTEYLKELKQLVDQELESRAQQAKKQSDTAHQVALIVSHHQGFVVGLLWPRIWGTQEPGGPYIWGHNLEERNKSEQNNREWRTGWRSGFAASTKHNLQISVDCKIDYGDEIIDSLKYKISKIPEPVTNPYLPGYRVMVVESGDSEQDYGLRHLMGQIFTVFHSIEMPDGRLFYSIANLADVQKPIYQYAGPSNLTRVCN